MASHVDSDRTQSDSRELTQDEVETRLKLNSGTLIAEIHDRLAALLDVENARSSTLEAKANSLAAVNGLTATAAFSFGGATLLGHPEYFASVSDGIYHLAGFLLIGTVLVGLASGAAALAVVRVVTQKTLDDKDVLGETILNIADFPRKHSPRQLAADEARGEDPPAADEARGEDPPAADRARGEDDGLTCYRRYMAAHVWTVTRSVEKVNDKKARILVCAQTLFLASVFATSLLGTLVGAVVMTRHPQRDNSHADAGSAQCTDGGTANVEAAANAQIRDAASADAVAQDAKVP